MRTRIVASDKQIELIIIIRKGFNVSSSEKNNIYTTLEKTILSLASLFPSKLRFSGNKLPRLKKMSSLPWCIITIFVLHCQNLRILFYVNGF
jgi:hypothetical protein